jgi:PncC family amidohydrolase
MHVSPENLVKEIHRAFTERNLTLSVAESCTGGLIADLITDVPGASEFFDSGIITYSNSAKTDVIGVRQITIIKWGAVSKETAREMADGIRNMRKTDFSLAVTGNVGPSAMEDKEIGLVYFAVASREDTFSKKMNFSGKRREIKKQAAVEGLHFLLEMVHRKEFREEGSGR